MHIEKTTFGNIKRLVKQKQEGWTSRSRTISIRVTQELYDLLKKYSASKQKTMQNVLEEAILLYLERESSVNNSIGGKK